MIQGAIFDMDGTLLDSMCVWEQLSQSYLNKFGVQITAEDYTALEGHTQYQNAEYFCARYAAITESAEQVATGMDALIHERYEALSKPRDGVFALLDALKAAKVPMAVATLTDRKHAEWVLKKHNLYDYFSFILTINDAGVSKREPRIYHMAAERFGVAAADCMVFEDAPYAGETAKRAGFQVCGLYEPWYAAGSQQLREASDLFIEYSYHEVLDKIVHA